LWQYVADYGIWKEREPFFMSILSVLAAGIAAWIFGAVYYGSLSRPWMAAAGLTEDDIKGPSGKPDFMPYVISLVLEILMAFGLAMLLVHIFKDGYSVGDALSTAGAVWLGFIASTQIINHRYSLKPWSLTIIDCGHWLGAILMMGLVLAWLQ
jgi:asparagine N-glycosylation enzyme membrane subunit Stt3